MAYIGNQPAESFTSFATQEFSTSATTSYTLDHAVTNENEIALFVNNVRQQPGSGKAYTATGTALTLSAATASTDTMYCVFLGRALQTVTPATNSITAAMVGNDLISGKDALTDVPATTDELLISDAGTLKRLDFSVLSSGMAIKKITVNEGITTAYGSLGPGDTTLTNYNVAHTALSTSNKLAFLISIPYTRFSGTNIGITNLKINDGSSDIITGLYYNYNGGTGVGEESLVAMKFDHTPSSTSAITYTLKATIYRPSGSETVTIGDSNYPGRVVCVEY